MMDPTSMTSSLSGSIEYWMALASQNFSQTPQPMHSPRSMVYTRGTACGKGT